MSQIFFIFFSFDFCRLKQAQLSIKRITGEKKVETRKINPNSLVNPDFDRMGQKYLKIQKKKNVFKSLAYFLNQQKERLRQKEANLSLLS